MKMVTVLLLQLQLQYVKRTTRDKKYSIKSNTEHNNNNIEYCSVFELMIDLLIIYFVV